MIDPIVAAILAAVPEFAGPYIDLVEVADGDPGAAAALTELAEFVAVLVLEMERHRPLLMRCLAGVEAAAQGSEDGDDLVSGAFLDSLSPDELGAIRPWVGPHTRSLHDRVEPGIVDSGS